MFYICILLILVLLCIIVILDIMCLLKLVIFDIVMYFWRIVKTTYDFFKACVFRFCWVDSFPGVFDLSRGVRLSHCWNWWTDGQLTHVVGGFRCARLKPLNRVKVVVSVMSWFGSKNYETTRSNEHANVGTYIY